MPKKLDREIEEVTNTLRAFEQEAMQMATRAFNEGYLLGIKHGHAVFGDGKDEN